MPTFLLSINFTLPETDPNFTPDNTITLPPFHESEIKKYKDQDAHHNTNTIHHPPHIPQYDNKDTIKISKIDATTYQDMDMGYHTQEAVSSRENEIITN